MNQFNPNTYKKRSALQEFYHSCLGKFVILVAIVAVVLTVAFMTRPTDNMMYWQAEDSIRECLNDNDSIQQDAIDDYVANIGRLFTHADTTETDRELWATFCKHNRVAVYAHPFFKTAYVHHNNHPEGVRIGIGVFGIVIPTIKYTDLLMNTGTIRGEYGEQLIEQPQVPEQSLGENPDVQPYHYQGNPDN